MINNNSMLRAAAAVCVLMAGCTGGKDIAGVVGTLRDTSAPARADDTTPVVDDVVVIAVIDSNINPYHWDYVGAFMPQNANQDPADDLPLDQDPATWVPGHPGAEAFASYEAVKLTYDTRDEFRSTAELHDRDQAQWAKIRSSAGTSNDEVNMYYFPGSKIIGHVVFGSGTASVDTWAESSHGIGTSSVSAGNLHGSCPHCLLVYVHGTSEQANEWVAKQDWIDLQTNSWGLSLVMRDRAYAGSDTELQREAIDRGQQIFFSAGNGQGNAFVVPNTTLQSSQEGPDWIVTVGAVAPNDQSSYSGHGKPADIASIGSGYPSAYGNDGTVNGSGNFSGTSNATPVIAGMYGEALYRLRRLLPGASRTQHDGVIATGSLACGAANPDCALADGELTVHELREALYRAARYSDAIWNVGGVATVPAGTPEDQELEFLSEGHGSYIGRLHGDDEYEQEIERIVGYAAGDWFEEQDPDQVAWFAADSYCRQSVWGEWEHGYAQFAEVPGDDPNWPVRTALVEACPSVIGALVEAEKAYAGAR